MKESQANASVFAPLFQNRPDFPGYLPLLNLTVKNAPESVRLVRECCGKSPEPFPAICDELKASGWRHHLVACVAAIISGYDQQVVALLWAQLDAGSWVTPQLAVALHFRDPDFVQGARSRVERGCPIQRSPLLPLDEYAQSAAAARMPKDSPKAVASLLYLLQLESPTPEWLATLSISLETKALLARDFDDSGRIAAAWLERITRLTGENR